MNLNGVSLGGANTAEVVAAATAFLETLNPTQMAKVVYDFSNNTARQTWSNYPARVVPRSGTGMSDLSTAQQSGVDTMLQPRSAPPVGCRTQTSARPTTTWPASAAKAPATSVP